MNGLENEIRQHIDRKNKEMLELLTFDHFTLNKRVHELMKENHELQEKCHHKFDENGRCIYCDYEKENLE